MVPQHNKFMFNAEKQEQDQAQNISIFLIKLLDKKGSPGSSSKMQLLTPST